MKPSLERNIHTVTNSSFKIFRIKESYLKPYWHYHPEIEIVWVIKGYGIRCVGDDVSPFVPGELIIIGENVPHNFISNADQNDDEVETICIQFDRHIFQAFLECRHFNMLFEEASTGISIDRVFCLFLVDAGKSFIRAIQSIGRGLRKGHDKEKVHCVDVHSGLKWSMKHFRERKKYYKEAQYNTLKTLKMNV